MKILLIEDKEERYLVLKEYLKDLPGIGILHVARALYIEPPTGLDAIFMTLPAAEKWGPDFKSREAQIVETMDSDRERGFPWWVVTGVNLSPEDPKDPVSQMRIMIRSALTQVAEYNLRNNGKIQRLGFWVMDLTRSVTMGQLSDVLHELLAHDSCK